MLQLGYHSIMRALRGVLCSFFVVLVAEAAAAQFERRLAPIAVTGTLGAFSSSWTTRATVLAEQGVEIVGLLPVNVPPGFSGSIPQLAVLPPSENEPPGTILYIPADRAQGVHVSTVLRRGSSNDLTFLPVVREQEFTSAARFFMQLKKEEGKRLRLRVYSLDLEHSTPTVRLRIQSSYPLTDQPWTVALDSVITLTARQKMMTDYQGTVSLPVRPLAVEVSLDDLLTSVPAGADLAVSVVPTTDLRIWAFVSQTDNATQAVEIVPSN
jgi:hypothetical protein